MADGFRPLSVPQFGPWFRFQSPLVKLDVQIARIQLSPASSDLRARQVGTSHRQGIEAEGLIEILVRMLAVSGASSSAASHQPSLKTSLSIPAYSFIGPEDRPLIEVRRPATE